MAQLTCGVHPIQAWSHGLALWLVVASCSCGRSPLTDVKGETSPNSQEASQIGGPRVTIANLSVHRTEVTVAQYERCVASGKCSPAEIDDLLCNWKVRSVRPNHHPINCVSFEQARAYCEFVGMRLPTATEWTLVAGGTEGRRYPWGDDEPSNLWITENFSPGPARHKLCWVGDGTDTATPYPERTCPVGSYPAGDTPEGVADMAGNVAEWVTDVDKLPHGSSVRRVYGGGFSYDPLGPLEVGTTDFDIYSLDHYAPDIGFRCVR